MRDLAAFVMLASSVLAQGRIWIVDQANGPGTDFLDLAAAEPVVAPGDVLRVRTGQYRGIATSKGITILGEGSVTLTNAAPTTPTYVLRVSSLPAGQTFALAGVTVSAQAGPAGLVQGLVVENTLGGVYLDDVTADNPNGPGIEVSQAAHFTARGGAGLRPARVDRSTATFQGCPLPGRDAYNLFGGHLVSGSPGLIATASTVYLSRCNLRGGNGGAGSFGFPMVPGMPALLARECRIVLTGDTTTTVRSGAYLLAGPVVGIQADGGRLELDPQVTVSGADGGLPIAGNATVVTRQIPSLWTSATRLGATWSIELDSPTGNLVSIALGVPIVPIASPFGSLALDPASLVTLVFAATQGPSGRLGLNLTVPGAPTLTGAALAVQALDYAPTTGLEISNPAVVVLR